MLSADLPASWEDEAIGPGAEGGVASIQKGPRSSVKVQAPVESQVRRWKKFCWPSGSDELVVE